MLAREGRIDILQKLSPAITNIDTKDINGETLLFAGLDSNEGMAHFDSLIKIIRLNNGDIDATNKQRVN